MISVEYNGTEYQGRLIYLQAIEETARDFDGNCTVVRNKGYDLTLMDANGGIIYLVIKDLGQIRFM